MLHSHHRGVLWVFHGPDSHLLLPKTGSQQADQQGPQPRQQGKRHRDGSDGLVWLWRQVPSAAILVRRIPAGSVRAVSGQRGSCRAGKTHETEAETTKVNDLCESRNGLKISAPPIGHRFKMEITWRLSQPIALCVPEYLYIYLIGVSDYSDLW